MEQAADQKAREEKAATDRENAAIVSRNQAAFSMVYRITIDKAQRDLTRARDRAIAYCVSIGW